MIKQECWLFLFGGGGGGGGGGSSDKLKSRYPYL